MIVIIILFFIFYNCCPQEYKARGLKTRRKKIHSG